MTATQRLFFGIPVPEPVGGALAASIAPVRDREKRARWIPRGNWHLTLRFLGDLASEQRDEIIRGLNVGRLPGAFSVRLSGWGTFPRKGRVEVLWVGVEDGTGRLQRIAEVIEEAVVTAGLSPETRPFRPHLTLARFRPPVSARTALSDLPSVDARLDVDRFVLFESTLGSGPPRYRPLLHHPLENA